MGEDINYEDGEEDREAQQNDVTSSTTTTSTEPPKRIGPVIRPFRSNEDLLLALKRRRSETKNPEPRSHPKYESKTDDVEPPAQNKPVVESPKIVIDKSEFY